MATDAYVPYVVPDRNGNIDADQVNRAIRYLAEAVNALAGRTGAISIFDDVSIEGSLTVQDELGVGGDITPDTDGEFDLGDATSSDQFRWRNVAATDSLSLDQDGVVVWAPVSGTSRFGARISSPIAQELDLELDDNNTSFHRLNISSDVDGLRLDGTTSTGDDLHISSTGVQGIRVDASSQVFQQTDNGGQWIRGQLSEEVTLTGSTTNSSSNLLPTNSLIRGVVARVTQTITRSITPPTNLFLGDSSSAKRFIGNVSGAVGVTAGSTGVGIDQWDGAVAAKIDGPTQTANSPILITIDGAGAVSAGKVRLTSFFETFVPPTS